MALLGSIGIGPSEAGATRFTTGFSDTGYQSPDESKRLSAFEKTVQARAGMVRVEVQWSGVAAERPSNPADPADSAYDFEAIDYAIVGARAFGLEPMVLITGAPGWAQGPNPPPASDHPNAVGNGAWKPDPKAFGAFAHAVATRYSGHYASLPRVRYYEAWNEPNLSGFLAPQWRANGAPFAPHHYRQMVIAFAAGVRAVNKRNLVVAGATAPYGDEKGGLRMRPLRFWREFLCLRPEASGTKSKVTGCDGRPRFDIASHHPINTSGGPRRSALHPDDISTPDIDNLARLLRLAEREDAIAGARRRHPLWATEIWWQSNPPDVLVGVPLATHARWVQESLYVLWEQGVEVVINLPLTDGRYGVDEPYGAVQSGVFFEDGSPKPAYTAFRFPFVTDKGTAWGKAPVSGRLIIEQRAGGGWKRVHSRRVKAGRVFTARLSVDGPARFRASVGAERSLVWTQR